ncbi:MAG TPA: host attachment family protein [Pseudoxanthomonas sp.]|nr:host attachment family protein [Pseudoxanthomonas sp.]
MRRIPQDAWILVADGASARLFRNVGEDGQLRLHQEELIALDPAEGVMPAALPAEADARDMDEASFARQLAQRLNQDALHGRYRHLVLAADPQTLGQIRPLLHEEARGRLLAELAKDYTNAPREDIERALARVEP